MKCGDCRWFDGEGWLGEDGTGRGECTLEPPVWIGVPGVCMSYEDWLGYAVDDGWSRPMVGVASKPCRHFEQNPAINIDTGLE